MPPLSRLIPFLALCALFVLPFAAPFATAIVGKASWNAGFAAAEQSLLDTGLVPACGTKSAPTPAEGGGTTVTYTPCSTCHFAQLVQNLLNFVWKYVALAGVALMLMVGGFYMITGGLSGSADSYKKGLRIIKNAFIGLAIVLFSWLAIDTIIKFIARKQGESIVTTTPAELPQLQSLATDDLGSVTTMQFGPWNKIKCAKLDPVKVLIKPPPPSAQPPTTPPTPAPLPQPQPAPEGPPLDTILQNQQNAAELEARGVRFSQSAGCGGVSAKTNFQELRTAHSLTACSSSCTSTSGCGPSHKTADPLMLQDLLFLTFNGYNYEVSSIATGKHAAGSAHYEGKAIDLVPRSGTTFLQLWTAMSNRNPSSTRIKCEDNGGSIISGCGAGTTHVHVTYP